MKLGNAILSAALLATPAAAANSNEYAKIGTVGIVSTVGSTFILKRIGVTVFGNSEQKIPVAWNIDGLLIRDLAAALAQRFTVKPVAFDANALKQCWDWKKCISLLPPDPAIDAYLFVQEASMYVRGGNLDPHGIGVYRTQRPFLDDANLLHVLYRVDAVDAKTGEHIDYGTGRLSETVAFGEHAYPVKAIDPPLLPDSDSQLSRVQMESLRPMVNDLIQTSYVRALINANLLPESAASAPR